MTSFLRLALSTRVCNALAYARHESQPSAHRDQVDVHELAGWARQQRDGVRDADFGGSAVHKLSRKKFASDVCVSLRAALSDSVQVRQTQSNAAKGLV